MFQYNIEKPENEDDEEEEDEDDSFGSKKKEEDDDDPVARKLKTQNLKVYLTCFSSGELRWSNRYQVCSSSCFLLCFID